MFTCSCLYTYVMYVMHVIEYVRMFVYTNVRLYACVSTSIFAYVNTFAYKHECMLKQVGMHAYVYIHRS